MSGPVAQTIRGQMVSHEIVGRIGGTRGPQGYSAYEVWVRSGHNGTVEDFWNWLVSQYPLTITGASGQAVNARALMAAIADPVAGQLCFLVEEGREGQFVYSSDDFEDRYGNLSTLHDPEQIAFVPPNTDATGASGAWVRVVTDNDLWLEMTGAKPGGDPEAGANVFTKLKALVDFNRRMGGIYRMRYGCGAWPFDAPDYYDAEGEVDVDDPLGQGIWADYDGFRLVGPGGEAGYFKYKRGMRSRGLMFVGNRNFENGVDEFLPNIVFENLSIDMVNGGGGCMGLYIRRPYGSLKITAPTGWQSGIDAGELMLNTPGERNADRWFFNFAPNPKVRSGEDNREARGGKTDIKWGESRDRMQFIAGGGWGIEDFTVAFCTSYDADANAFAFTTNATVARAGKVISIGNRAVRASGRGFYLATDDRIGNQGTPAIGAYPKWQAVTQQVTIIGCQTLDCQNGLRIGAQVQGAYQLNVPDIQIEMSSPTGNRVRFGPGDIDLATGIITIRSHNFYSGQGAYLTLDAGAVAPGGMVASLLGNGIYTVERLNKDQIKLWGLVSVANGLQHPVIPTNAGSGGFGLNFMSVSGRRLAVGDSAGADVAANTVTVLGDDYDNGAPVRLGLLSGTLPGGLVEHKPYWLGVESAGNIDPDTVQSVVKLYEDEARTILADITSAPAGSFNLYLTDPDLVTSGVRIQENSWNWANQYHGNEASERFAAADVDVANNTIALDDFATGQGVQLSELSNAPGGMAVLDRFYVEKTGGLAKFYRSYDGTTFSDLVDLTSTGSGSFTRLAPLIRHSAVDVAGSRIVFDAPHNLPPAGGLVSVICVTGRETMIGGVASGIPYYARPDSPTSIELYEQVSPNTGDFTKRVNITSQGLGFFQVAYAGGATDVTFGDNVWIDPKHSTNVLRCIRNGRFGGYWGSRVQMGSMADVRFMNATFDSLVVFDQGGAERVVFATCNFPQRGNDSINKYKMELRFGDLYQYDVSLFGCDSETDLEGVASTANPDGFLTESLPTTPSRRKGPGLTVRRTVVKVSGTGGPWRSFDMAMANVASWKNVDIPEDRVTIDFGSIATGAVGTVDKTMLGYVAADDANWTVTAEPVTNKASFDTIPMIRGTVIDGAFRMKALNVGATINPPSSTFKLNRERV